jgi:hypothetical protein
MQPEQQNPWQRPQYAPQPSPAQQNGYTNTGQYDFILDSAPKNRPTIGGKRGLLLILGFAVGVVLLLWLILSLVFGGNGSATAPYVNLAGQQAEMIRLTTAATSGDNLQTGDAKSFAANTLLTLSTDQQATVALLSRNGVKLKAQDLAANKNTTLDKSLADAQQNGTYDKTYIDTMQNLLKKYQTKLQQTFSAAQSNNEKQLLQKEFKNAALLYEQSSQQN